MHGHDNIVCFDSCMGVVLEDLMHMQCKLFVMKLHAIPLNWMMTAKLLNAIRVLVVYFRNASFGTTLHWRRSIFSILDILLNCLCSDDFLKGVHYWFRNFLCQHATFLSGINRSGMLKSNLAFCLFLILCLVHSLSSMCCHKGTFHIRLWRWEAQFCHRREYSVFHSTCDCSWRRKIGLVGNNSQLLY